ncbi:unnamed protein product [Leptosia nina]|uniref:CHK kinase-like domain-containing protein n=1 Tax=Leptosia nina TaxID=320188 RepID=A0AAV1JZ78_9NEOP
MGYLELSNVSELLTNEVLDKIFKLKTNSQDHVVKSQVSRVGPAGEGLLSAVYRICVTGEKYSTSYVAKGLVNDLLLRRTLNCTMFFHREVMFFSKILPLFTEFQRSLNAKESLQKYIPFCYHYHCDGQADYLILEDLSENGYCPISHSPSDTEREGILKVIALLHAVSMAMRLKNPELFFKLANEFPECYFNERRRAWYCKWLRKAVEVDKEVVCEYEDKIDKVYYEKFMNLINSDTFKQQMEISNTWGDHTVFNHGDCWYANFLGSSQGVVGIDFQLFRFASPATDLTFFLMGCCDSPHKEDFTKSLDVYYSYFRHFMDDMNIDAQKVFPRHTLDAELKKYGKFGFLSALTSLPLIVSEKCDVMQSFETKFSDKDIIPLEDIWILTPFKTEKQKLKLINALRVSVDLGFI